METGFLFNSIIILLMAFLTTSCVTPKEKRVSTIRVGMLKDEVLEAAGSPTTFARYQGKDRWIYRIEKGSDIVTIEVQFTNGKAIYVGSPPTPSLSAEEQDKYNQIYNQRQDETENKIIEERRKKKKSPHPEESTEEEL